MEKIEKTAKQLAAQEEVAAAEAIAARNAENEAAKARSEEPVSIIGLAAQGREVLLDHLRKHAQANKPVEYVPPGRTERQMTALEEELEAGRRAQAKAQAQFDARPVPKADLKEGFTTPVHRPGDFVPNLNSKDPAITK